VRRPFRRCFTYCTNLAEHWCSTKPTCGFLTTADLTKILNNGTVKGMPVLRTMTNRHRELNPKAFRVFGPKLIAMREGFQDEALESRFLTADTTVRSMRPGIPIHLPDSQKTEALALRNKLLRWRFDNRTRIAVNPARAISGLSPRGNQSALALLSLIDDNSLRDAIGTHLATTEALGVNRRAALPHVAMVGVLLRCFGHNPTSPVTIAKAVADFNAQAIRSNGCPLSSKAAGYLIRVKLGLTTTKSNGIFLIPTHERPKVVELASRYGLVIDESSKSLSSAQLD
jgi:hypothetical protein